MIGYIMLAIFAITLAIEPTIAAAKAHNRRKKFWAMMTNRHWDF